MYIDEDNIEYIIIGVLAVVWVIGFYVWQDSIWPFTILINFLGDLGIGHGTSSGYPWENGSAGQFPHSRYS